MKNIKKIKYISSKKITLNDLTCPYCKKSGFDISGIFAICNYCEMKFKMYIITPQYNITKHLKDLFYICKNYYIKYTNGKNRN